MPQTQKLFDIAITVCDSSSKYSTEVGLKMACGCLILFEMTFMSPEKAQELVSGLRTPLWFTDRMLGCDFCKSTAVHSIVRFYI